MVWSHESLEKLSELWLSYLLAHLHLLLLTLSLLWSSHFFSSPLWLFPPLLFQLSIWSDVWSFDNLFIYIVFCGFICLFVAFGCVFHVFMFLICYLFIFFYFAIACLFLCIYFPVSLFVLFVDWLVMLDFSISLWISFDFWLCIHVPRVCQSYLSIAELNCHVGSHLPYWMRCQLFARVCRCLRRAARHVTITDWHNLHPFMVTSW